MATTPKTATRSCNTAALVSAGNEQQHDDGGVAAMAATLKAEKACSNCAGQPEHQYEPDQCPRLIAEISTDSGRHLQ